jgi:hypothetical protein
MSRRVLLPRSSSSSSPSVSSSSLFLLLLLLLLLLHLLLMIYFLPLQHTEHVNEGYTHDEAPVKDEHHEKGHVASANGDTVIPIIFAVDDHYPEVKKKEGCDEDDDDPWALPELHSTDTPWQGEMFNNTMNVDF